MEHAAILPIAAHGKSLQQTKIRKKPRERSCRASTSVCARARARPPACAHARQPHRSRGRKTRALNERPEHGVCTKRPRKGFVPEEEVTEHRAA